MKQYIFVVACMCAKSEFMRRKRTATMRKQKVVVVHDASKDVCWPALKWIPHGFNLKPGDEFILLGVFRDFNYSSFLQPRKLFGCGRKTKLHSVFGYNKAMMEKEVARKKEQYHNNENMRTLSKQCEMEKIKFHIEMLPAVSRKVVAVEFSIRLGATWVILDREMKKYKSYFIEKLSCGISRMKRNNGIQQLRGPTSIVKSYTCHQILYDEMIPGESCEAPNPSSSGEHFMLGKASISSQRNYASVSSGLKEFEKPSLLMDFLNEGNKPRTNQTTYDRHHHNVSLTNKKQKKQVIMENIKCSVCSNTRPKMETPRDFTYAELKEATNKFSRDNILSEGGFGYVFRGELRNNGTRIAVKHHKYGSLQGDKEFKSEVDVLSKARHDNLVILLGACSDGSRRLLVYEYVCNGSLDHHLKQDAKTPLTWEKRIKIALGAAKGLEYLHSRNIIHRDMSSNNILITHDHETLLGDFGLAKMQNGDSIQNSSNRVVGTVGYFAPEYAENGEVSTKMDVYSFGVVLLQLITGLAMTDNELQGNSLVGWATPLLEEKNYPYLVDKRIIDSYDVHQLYCMVQVAEKCLSNRPEDRCTMEEVVIALSDIIREGNAL